MGPRDVGGFPIGMSAAADNPARASARICVVSSIGYTAFVAGPPLIGLMAQNAGILRALFIVVGALSLALLASGASRSIDTVHQQSATPSTILLGRSTSS